MGDEEAASSAGVNDDRLRVEGREHIPRCGGVILAGNHVSYVDPFLIGVAAKRELSYVTKRDVFAMPGLAWLLPRINAIPMDRSRGDRGALTLIEKRLSAGGAMFFFPEGTRNKASGLLKPKAGVGMMIHRTSVPVVPTHISGTVNVWKNLAGLSRVVVRFGRPIEFRPDGLPQRRRDAYQSISCEVMRKIGELGQGKRDVDPVAPPVEES